MPEPNDANDDVEEIEGDSFFMSLKDERAAELEFRIRLLWCGLLCSILSEW